MDEFRPRSGEEGIDGGAAGARDGLGSGAADQDVARGAIVGRPGGVGTGQHVAGGGAEDGRAARHIDVGVAIGGGEVEAGAAADGQAAGDTKHRLGAAGDGDAGGAFGEHQLAAARLEQVQPAGGVAHHGGGAGQGGAGQAGAAEHQVRHVRGEEGGFAAEDIGGAAAAHHRAGAGEAARPTAGEEQHVAGDGVTAGGSDHGGADPHGVRSIDEVGAAAEQHDIAGAIAERERDAARPGHDGVGARGGDGVGADPDHDQVVPLAGGDAAVAADGVHGVVAVAEIEAAAARGRGDVDAAGAAAGKHGVGAAAGDVVQPAGAGEDEVAADGPAGDGGVGFVLADENGWDIVGQGRRDPRGIEDFQGLPARHRGQAAAGGDEWGEAAGVAGVADIAGGLARQLPVIGVVERDLDVLPSGAGEAEHCGGGDGSRGEDRAAAAVRLEAPGAGSRAGGRFDLQRGAAGGGGDAQDPAGADRRGGG